MPTKHLPGEAGKRKESSTAKTKPEQLIPTILRVLMIPEILAMRRAMMKLGRTLLTIMLSTGRLSSWLMLQQHPAKSECAAGC